MKTDSSVLDNLTPRQMEILALMAQGYTNKAIAAKLVVSRGCIIGHAFGIFHKLGVSGRQGMDPRVLAVQVYLNSGRYPGGEL